MTKGLKMLLVTFYIGMITTQAQTKMQNQMTQEEKRVLNAVEKMTSNFEKGMIDEVMQSYERDAMVVFDPGKPISDPDLLRKMFEDMSGAKPKFSYSGHQVFISGDIAIHIAPWEMNGMAPDGSTIQQEGLSIVVLRKQSNGEWLMVIDNPHGQMLLNN